MEAVIVFDVLDSSAQKQEAVGRKIFELVREHGPAKVIYSNEAQYEGVNLWQRDLAAVVIRWEDKLFNGKAYFKIDAKQNVRQLTPQEWQII